MSCCGNKKWEKKDHNCCCKDCECKSTPKCKKCGHTAKECDCGKCKCDKTSSCCGSKK